MTTTPKNPKIKTDWTPLAFGIILAIVGAAFIVLKEYINYIGFAVGALVCAGSIVLATLTFTGKRSGALFIFKTIFSVLALATGIVTMVCNDSATMIVCLVFAGALTIDGSVKLGDSIQARRYTVYGRTVSLVLALISTVSAMLVIRFITAEKIVDYAAALGICFLLDAVCNITIPFLKSRINSAVSRDLVEKTREVVAEEIRAEEEKAREEEAKAAALEEAKRAEEKTAEEELKKIAEERAAKEAEEAPAKEEATEEATEEAPSEAQETTEEATDAPREEVAEEVTEAQEATEAEEVTETEEATEAEEAEEESLDTLPDEDLSPVDFEVLGDEDESTEEEDESVDAEEAEDTAEEDAAPEEDDRHGKKKKKKKKNRRR